MKNTARKKSKGRIDRSETFDEFLANDGLLPETEDAAIKKIIAGYGECGGEEFEGGVRVTSEGAAGLMLRQDALRYSALQP